MEDLAIRILKQKIEEKLYYINLGKYKFDKNINYFGITLTERQFNVVKKHFNLKVVRVLGQGLSIDDFSFENWKVEKIGYNDRFNCYELLVKDIAYIEDEEKYFEYTDLLYRE